MNISIDQEALTALLNRVEELKQQNQELHEALSRKKEEERGLRFQVWQFHEKFGYPVRHEVTELTTEELRFRLSLVMEEAMEALEACVWIENLPAPEARPWTEYYGEPTRVARRAIADAIALAVPDDADLVELVDALADLDYVVEGTRLYLGVKGSEIAAEVHRANMAKSPDRKNGKPSKPEGWTPPDIEGVLRKQGWKGAQPDPVAKTAVDREKLRQQREVELLCSIIECTFPTAAIEVEPPSNYSSDNPWVVDVKVYALNHGSTDLPLRTFVIKYRPNDGSRGSFWLSTLRGSASWRVFSTAQALVEAIHMIAAVVRRDSITDEVV